MPHSRRLNLGCGPGRLPPDWVHLDGSWNARLARHRVIRRTLGRLGIISRTNAALEWHPEIICADLRRPLPFPAGAFEAVYASHVLEHLHDDEARALLDECYRVLQPEGVIRLVVPDLRYMVRRYLEAATASERNGELAADRLNEDLHLRPRSSASGHMLFRAYSALTEFHWHKWLYDAESLMQRTRGAGFTAVEQRGYLDSRIGGIGEIEHATRVLDGAGICIEGLKP